MEAFNSSVETADSSMTAGDAWREFDYDRVFQKGYLKLIDL